MARRQFQARGISAFGQIWAGGDVTFEFLVIPDNNGADEAAFVFAKATDPVLR